MPRRKALKEDEKLNEVKQILDKSTVSIVVENESNEKIDINSNIKKENATKKASSKKKNIPKNNDLNQNNDVLKVEPAKEIVEKNISIKQKARINDSKKAKAAKEKSVEKIAEKVNIEKETLISENTKVVDIEVPKVVVDEVQVLDLSQVKSNLNLTSPTNKKSKSKSSKKIIEKDKKDKIEPIKDEIIVVKEEPIEIVLKENVIEIIEIPPTKEPIESVPAIPSKNALRKARIKEAKKAKKLNLQKQIELEKNNVAEVIDLPKEPIGQILEDKINIDKVESKINDGIKDEKIQDESINSIPTFKEVIEKKSKSKNKKQSKKSIQPIQKEQIPPEIDINKKAVQVIKEVLPEILIENAEIKSDGDSDEQYIVIDLNKKLSINPVFNANQIVEAENQDDENQIETIDEIIPIEITPETTEIAEKPRSKNYKKNQKRKLAIRKAKELEQLNKAELLKAEAAKLAEDELKKMLFKL